MNDITTMRAISQDILGGPEVLKEVRLPRPTPGPGEVLVRVHAAGVNPTDWKHRSIPGLFLGEPPFVLGWDFSGVVVESQTWRFEPGDEVFGMPSFPRPAHAYAESAMALRLLAPGLLFAYLTLVYGCAALFNLGGLSP